MASRDLMKRLQALEAEHGDKRLMTAGHRAAFKALRAYPAGTLTWDQFHADHHLLAVDDLRIAYEGIWSMSAKMPHVFSSYAATLECPPWAKTPLEGKQS